MGRSSDVSKPLGGLRATSPWMGRSLDSSKGVYAGASAAAVAVAGAGVRRWANYHPLPLASTRALGATRLRAALPSQPPASPSRVPTTRVRTAGSTDWCPRPMIAARADAVGPSPYRL